ncbi:MAG: formate acetyltransferase, partial [Streptomyces sp.]|nr:formate acetyltransferase [Streptomyces sp.]
MTVVTHTAGTAGTAGEADLGAWRGFGGTVWRERVDVPGFVRANYTPYEGDSGFLTGPTARTRTVWEKVAALFPEERRRGVYDVDPAT